jgi:ATP-binding cassette subfamily B (MDR/TAP) protein 1
MTTRSPASSSNVAIDEKHGSPSEEVKPPMAHLSEQEKEIIERQIDAPKLTVGYFSLFRYANKMEFFIMVIAFIASIAAGAVMPLMTVRLLDFASIFHLNFFFRCSSMSICTSDVQARAMFRHQSIMFSIRTTLALM